MHEPEPTISQEILLAGVREVMFQVLELRPEDGPQRRAFKLCLAAWAADRAGLLPHSGIAIVLGKKPSFVSYAIAATERRRTAHRGFQMYSDKLVEKLTAALTEPGMRRI